VIPLFLPNEGRLGMRGLDEQTDSLFSYVDLQDRIPGKYPLRVIRRIANDVLAALDGEFANIYADSGRPSIPPERLLRRCCFVFGAVACSRNTRFQVA
jgi:hypothetical protein